MRSLKTPFGLRASSARDSSALERIRAIALGSSRAPFSVVHERQPAAVRREDREFPKHFVAIHPVKGLAAGGDVRCLAPSCDWRYLNPAK
jgi:hypothetical protein